MTLSHETLSQVRDVVTHANCPDGLMSALILCWALPDQIETLTFLKYETDEHKNVPVRPGTLFCDFTPHKNQVEAFVEAGAIVLDHHKTAKDVVALFGDRGVFADEETDKGVSGAMLAYREVFLPLSKESRDGLAMVYDMAELAGIRDTWQRQNPLWDKACEQASALLFPPRYFWFIRKESGVVEAKSAFDVSNWCWEMGPMLQDKQREKVKHAAEEGYRFETAAGTRVWMCNALSLVSDLADVVPDVDIVVAFKYTGDQVVYSTRGRNGYDVGSLCKHLGGGGHYGAAGCQRRAEHDRSPYKQFREMLIGYEVASKRNTASSTPPAPASEG